VGDPLSDREVRRRLAVLRHVEEVTGNVAMTARYFGISRQVYYTWLRRYRAEGLEGLRERSRRPKSCPHATHTEVVGKIIHLRENYHFGPTKISMYLKRYHDVSVSSSGVWRILKRLGLNRLPASQRYVRKDRRWKRYEKQQPGHRVQIDVKFIEPWPAPQPAVRPALRFGLVGGASTTSSRPSMTALVCGCCASTPSLTKRLRFSSWITSWRGCRLMSRLFRPTTELSFRLLFTGMCWTKGSIMFTSNLAHPGSTVKSNARTVSTPKSSIACLMVWSLTTLRFSMTNCVSGKTTTTTTDPTAPSAGKHRMKDYVRKHTQTSPIYRSRTY
jgi:transposase